MARETLPNIIMTNTIEPYVTTGNNFTKAANKSVKEASGAAVRHGMALHRGQGRKNHRHAQADDGIMLRGFKCKL